MSYIIVCVGVFLWFSLEIQLAICFNPTEVLRHIKKSYQQDQLSIINTWKHYCVAEYFEFLLKKLL